MNDFDEIINSYSTFYEPSSEEIGFCTQCDCQISLPDAPHGLCAVCEGAE